MYKHIDTLMQKEMSRQDFLKTLGIGMLSLFGFSSAIKMMTGLTGGHKVATNGYGSSPYGGGNEA
jgi:hypothetical protein